MNSKSTKKKLTGSIWALVVCFILLLGTTFAWFTDTASTNVNKIEAGTLDVALQKAIGVDNDGNIEWAELEKGEVLYFVDKEGNILEETLWEPGCTYKLPTLRVANNGSLALKYKVELESIVSATGDEKLAEVIDVYLGETKVGNLKEFIESKDNDGFAHGELTANTETGPLEISLHMQESAGNEYQAMTIDGIKVTVYATQLNSESDSYGPDYDKNAEYAQHVSSVEDLLAALKAGKKNIVLEENLSYTAPAGATPADFPYTTPNGMWGYIMKVQSDVTLDLNGHNITVNGDNNNKLKAFAFIEKGGNLTVRGNGTITVKSSAGSAQGIAAIWASNGGNATIEGGNFINENAVNADGISLESLVYANDRVSPSDERSTVHIYGGTFKYPKQTGASEGNWDNNTSGFNVRNYGYGNIIIHEGVLLSCEEFRQNHDSGVIKLADGCELQKITIDGTEWYKVVK